MHIRILTAAAVLALFTGCQGFWDSGSTANQVSKTSQKVRTIDPEMEKLKEELAATKKQLESLDEEHKREMVVLAALHKDETDRLDRKVKESDQRLARIRDLLGRDAKNEVPEQPPARSPLVAPPATP